MKNLIKQIVQEELQAERAPGWRPPVKRRKQQEKTLSKSLANTYWESIQALDFIDKLGENNREAQKKMRHVVMTLEELYREFLNK